jgi:hypothetical protein
MRIGIRNGKIIAFGKTAADLAMVATVRGLVFDSVEETDEEIVPYYGTVNDGIYYRASEVPPTPSEVANASIRDRRRELYGELSDPITNNISVLRETIAQGEYENGDELAEIESEIAILHSKRVAIRIKIANENPFIV